MPNITFKKLSNISEAEAAWKALSPNKVLYDDWDFRYCYYKYLNFPLEFIAGYDGDTLIGLLPLMWDPTTNLLDFFIGVNYMENNQIFVAPGYEYTRPEFLKQIDKPARLEDMDSVMKDLPGVVFHEDTYNLPLAGITSLEDYLTKCLSSKKRYNIKKALEIPVVVEKGTKEDIALLIQFNKERFKEASSFFTRPSWEKFLFDITQQFESIVHKVTKDGTVVAVGLSILYKNIYYDINTGRDTSIPSLGKIVALYKLKEAISLGAEFYDAGSVDFGWKEDFGLKKNPLYLLDYTK